MDPSPFTAHEVVGDPQFGRVAAFLVGAGALGVIVTSGFYALAGPQAALPGGAGSVEAARAATVHAAPWMRAAGLTGMPSDVVLAIGALMLAAMKRGRGAGIAVAGWMALALAAALFVVVDAMVAFVLPAAASLTGGEAAYAGLRALFDVLFSIGAWTAGAGALAASWSAHGPEYRRRGVLWAMRLAGGVGLAANSAYLLGLPGATLIGPGVALVSVAALLLAIALFSGGENEGAVAAGVTPPCGTSG